MEQMNLFALVTISTLATAKQDPCSYSCESNGGCSVKYIGSLRTGLSTGVCFSGSCSGTPPECKNCDQVLNCTGGSSSSNGGSTGRNSTAGEI